MKIALLFLLLPPLSLLPPFPLLPPLSPHPLEQDCLFTKYQITEYDTSGNIIKETIGRFEIKPGQPFTEIIESTEKGTSYNRKKIQLHDEQGVRQILNRTGDTVLFYTEFEHENVLDRIIRSSHYEGDPGKGGTLLFYQDYTYYHDGIEMILKYDAKGHLMETIEVLYYPYQVHKITLRIYNEWNALQQTKVIIYDPHQTDYANMLYDPPHLLMESESSISVYDKEGNLEEEHSATVSYKWGPVDGEVHKTYLYRNGTKQVITMTLECL